MALRAPRQYLCSRAQRAAVRKREGASSRRQSALSLPGRRILPCWVAAAVRFSSSPAASKDAALLAWRCGREAEGAFAWSCLQPRGRYREARHTAGTGVWRVHTTMQVAGVRRCGRRGGSCRVERRGCRGGSMVHGWLQGWLQGQLQRRLQGTGAAAGTAAGEAAGASAPRVALSVARRCPPAGRRASARSFRGGG